MSQPGPKKRTKKALGDLLAELSNPAPDTFDPETHGDDGLGRGNGDSDSDDNDFGYVRDETEGREHYLNVGAGKLRRSVGLDLAELGDRYLGERVSRKGLGLEQDAEEEEDDEDEEEEDAEEDGDEDEGEEGDDDNEDQDEDDSDEEEEEDDEDEDGMEYDQEKSDQIAADLKKMAEKEKELLRNVASNTNADAEKGAHVKNQLSIWESLLDLRIQMQTPLANANRFPVGEESYGAFTVASDILPKSTVASTTQAISKASTALQSFIQELLVTRAQLVVKNETVSLSPPDFATKLIKKRKRQQQQQQEEEAPEDVTQHLESLWTEINAFETAFEPFRDATIEKWSNKVMASTVASLGSDKKFKAINQSVLSQIRGILSDKERLVKRTRLVRGAGGEASRRLGAVLRSAQDQNEAASAAAADADADAPKTEREEIEAHEERENLKRRAGRGLDSHLSNFDDEVFDDGDFYQQLLKELIEGRLLETDDPLLLSMKWAELKQLQNKTKKKKVVDTKASKGRKIRFTVHEKLQNFMAPEPRGTWHEALIDDLFGRLFGAKMAVADESADAAPPSGSADAWGDVQVASDGLKLFG
ncbi:hypothetical protein HDU80_003993 [Chytriomyces hyalinus]|nr:hypothetical protein HDU80_003993 [Chytriomyces hyalinus]